MRILDSVLVGRARRSVVGNWSPLVAAVLVVVVLAAACGDPSARVSDGSAKLTSTSNLGVNATTQLLATVSGVQVGFDPKDHTHLFTATAGSEWVATSLPKRLQANWVYVGAGSSPDRALLGVIECRAGDECQQGSPHLFEFDVKTGGFTTVPLPEIPDSSHLGGIQGDGGRQWLLFSTFDNGVPTVDRYERTGNSWKRTPNPTFPDDAPVMGTSTCATGDTLVVVARYGSAQSAPPTGLDGGPNPSMAPTTTGAAGGVSTVAPSDEPVRWAAAQLVGDKWTPLDLPVTTARNLTLVCGGGLLGVQDFATRPEIWFTAAGGSGSWMSLADLAQTDTGGLAAILSAAAPGVLSAAPTSSASPLLVEVRNGSFQVRRIGSGVTTETTPDGRSVTAATKLVAAFGDHRAETATFDDRSRVRVADQPVIAERKAD